MHNLNHILQLARWYFRHNIPEIEVYICIPSPLSSILIYPSLDPKHEGEWGQLVENTTRRLVRMPYPLPMLSPRAIINFGGDHHHCNRIENLWHELKEFLRREIRPRQVKYAVNVT